MNATKNRTHTLTDYILERSSTGAQIVFLRDAYKLAFFRDTVLEIYTPGDRENMKPQVLLESLTVLAIRAEALSYPKSNKFTGNETCIYAKKEKDHG